LFYGAKITSVKHLGRTLPEGTSRQNTMPVNLKQLKVVSAKGAIISQLHKDGKLYMAVVNKDHNKSITVLIQNKNNTPRHITKAMEEEPMKTRYVVKAGDILMFRLK
jgi:redox-regulated HSP33 family molecular chaperone